MDDLLPVAAIIAGVSILVFGASRFVAGASGIARSAGMSPLVVGMVVVGLGTSAPELLVSITAALQGDGGLALGNAVGSNIANLGLVLAAGALVSPLLVPRAAGSEEIPRLLVTTGLASVLLYDGALSAMDGVLLAAALAVLMISVVRGARASNPEVSSDGPDAGAAPRWRHAASALAGLILLLAGSRAVVWGATAVARAYGVSDFVIGLTVVAIGTSLPELASTVVAARRGEAELVVGNIVGSNTFNTLAVIGVPAMVSPVPTFAASVLLVDLPVMLVLTAALALVGVRAHRTGSARVGRRWGVALLAIFLAHAAWTASQAVG